MRKIATLVLNLDWNNSKYKHGNVLEGVVGQAGNTQETCSRNPAPVRKILGQWVDLFFLKEHKKGKKKKFGIMYKGGLGRGGCHNRV